MMEDSVDVMIDADYEFSAPKFFDFIAGETEDQMREAQQWFDTALSYAPSPFMHKVKSTRTVQLESLCDFTEAEISHKEPVPSESTSSLNTMKNITLEPEKQNAKIALDPADSKEDVIASKDAKDELKESLPNQVCVDKKTHEFAKDASAQEHKSNGRSSSNVKVEQIQTAKSANPSQGAESCTPKPQLASQKNKNIPRTESKKQQTAKKIASALKNPSALKPKSIIKPASVRRDTNLTNKVGTPNLAQENQAIKRQKLEGGKTRQILNVKTQILPHKARPGVVNATPSSARSLKEERKMYVREQAPSNPFVSTAEMMRRFQSGTRDINLPRVSSLSHAESSQVMQRKAKLTLTRPKEPAFETSQRVRSVKIKSSAELEEEMMAKIPKFKARPINRKILEASTLPAMKRSTPQAPEFHEFHLETMERANQNAETSTIASIETAPQNHHQWKPHLTTPKTPPLQTLLRARPPKIKSTEELEKEELEKAPKFKARPLNKKIFESKGELGLFCNKKRQVTIPQEFHFAIDERIPPPTANVADLFDKLSLCSESHKEKPIRLTAPNPFHLHTEERGAEKEKRFVMEIIHKQIEEERARIPKATPYPYTTDYPVVPPKPEPKHCTKPEPFQLESLVRHEEEIQREMEERRRMEEEEARMRIFKAQPVLKEDPIPVPEKVRKPLTEVQAFDLQVEHRAVDRTEFDKKVKEKEMMYKRYRDEAESAKMMEEEKALKQLRRTLVPHARPVPNFDKPFLPRKSTKGVTKPKSPRLKITERTERRKMVVAAATSSAASNMR